jgi:hypothetical protein
VAAVFCDSCDFDTSGSGNGITVTPASGATVKELFFVNNWTCNSQSANGVYIGGNVDRVKVVSHHAVNNYTNGIWVNAGGAQNVMIEASEFSGNNQAGTAGNAGISLGSSGNSMSDVQVIGCRATGATPGGGATQYYGLYVASSTNNYILLGNNLRGNTGSNLSDNGGPNKVVANNLTS